MRKTQLLPANKFLTILKIFLVLLDVAAFRNHVFILENLQTVIYRVLFSYELDVFVFAGTACNVFILISLRTILE
jgi:hypothetical protein